MRRSKSDPAKYARNYRKISQRRMTQFDHLDEEREIKRLQAILKDSDAHLKRASEDAGDVLVKRRKRKRMDRNKKNDNRDHENEQQQQSNLSNDLELDETSNMIVLPNKKKPKVKKNIIQLTPEEIREAKLLQKQTTRKLQQLEVRAAQKEQRAALYKKLEQHQISSTALGLLSRSGQVSRKDSNTKKQTLKKLIKKERAGIELSKDEQNLLYPVRTVECDDETLEAAGGSTVTSQESVRRETKSEIKKMRVNIDISESPTRVVKDFISSRAGSQQDMGDDSSSEFSENIEEMEGHKKADSRAEEVQEIPSTGSNFAAQMMASLSQLKVELQREEECKGKEEVFLPEITPKKKYTPSETTQLKTAATLGIESLNTKSKRRVLRIERPESVEKARYELPVSATEFEIMDAIRSNDVTIICGETGSGKSTQVPQFLYESGMCLNEADPNNFFLVGITQPRRVAAVSTAKRVCYEMGCGDGQTIKGCGKKGNTVSYRTRYESAGVGTETCVQFMTDGVLLQEIQTDLLLRRYSVIVLDESHERNLNTDVLIGLLSVALPLRKKAAEEDPSLVPLKLILMSATLRVEDFTENKKLFPTGPPAVVNVPGRTFPVVVHHSKVTEVDNYGENTDLGL